MSEAEILEIVNKIADRYCHKFKFGSFDKDDIRQQCILFALKKLPKFSADRGSLENFLSVAVRNQIINFKRNNYVRQKDPPCLTCPFYDKTGKKSSSNCVEFDDRQCCELYAKWYKKTQQQKDLASPSKQVEISSHSLAENDIVDKASMKELYNTIKDKLPANLRADFLRLIDGVSMSQYRKDKIREFVSQWLKNQDD